MELKVLNLIEQKVKRSDNIAIYILSNNTRFGFSKIYFPNRNMNTEQFADKLGFIAIPKDEEGLFPCDFLSFMIFISAAKN